MVWGIRYMLNMPIGYICIQVICSSKEKKDSFLFISIDLGIFLAILVIHFN